MAHFRPLTTNHQVDLAQVAPAPEPRSLADLLPPISGAPAEMARKKTMSRAEITSMIVVGIIAIGVLAFRLGSSGAAAPAAPQSRPAAAAPTGEAILTPSPLPATAPVALGRVLIAFAAPDGAVLGAIESTREMTPTAHYGNGWIQADVAGSGLVWLRKSDAPELHIIGPDLAPRPTATQAPVIVATEPPTATPEPPCHSAGTGAEVVTVCGWGDLEQQARDTWIATYGAAAPTPYGGKP